MATRWTDSCDRYSVDSDLDVAYDTRSASIGVNTTAGRYGGGAITFDGTDAGSIRKTCLDASEISSENTFCINFHWKAPSTPSAEFGFMSVWPPTGAPDFTNLAGTGVNCWQIFMRTDGKLEIFDYGRDSGNFNGSVPNFNICDGLWHYVEIALRISNGSGLKRVDIDGSNYLNVTGDTSDRYNAPSGFVNQFGIWNSSGWSDLCYIDDLIVFDAIANGADINASTDLPLGISRIETLYPTGAGTNTDFTASAGANYTCVDEAVGNGDTDYVETQTIGHTDTYAFGNMVGSPTTVHTVAVKAQARDSQAQGQQLRGIAYSNATEGQSNTRVIPPNYDERVYAIGNNPDGDVAWTDTTINAAEFGFEAQ